MNRESNDAPSAIDAQRALEAATRAYDGDLVAFAAATVTPFVLRETTKYVLYALHALAAEAVGADPASLDRPIQTRGASWTTHIACGSFRDFSNAVAFDWMLGIIPACEVVRAATWLAWLGPGVDDGFSLKAGSASAWDALCASFALLHSLSVQGHLDAVAVPRPCVEENAVIYDRYVASLETTLSDNLGDGPVNAMILSTTPASSLSQFVQRCTTSTPFLEFSTPPWAPPAGLLSVAIGNGSLACERDIVGTIFTEGTQVWRAPLQRRGKLQLALASLVISGLERIVTFGAYNDPSSAVPAPGPRDYPFLYVVGARGYLFGSRATRDDGVVYAFDCMGTLFMAWRSAVRVAFRVDEEDGVSALE